MKTNFRILLLFLSGLMIWIAPALADPARDGIAAYEAGDLEAARDLFLEAAASDETPALRHNLALAEFRLGQVGEAAWQLERAILLDPLNHRYRIKLAALREQAGFFPGGTDWYGLGAQALPLNAWILLAASAFWLLLALLILPRCSGRRLRFGAKAVAWICALALVIALPAIRKQEQIRSCGIVIANGAASLHAAPATASPEAGQLRPAERARVLDARENFFQIESESGATGWIARANFRPLLP